MRSLFAATVTACLAASPAAADPFSVAQAPEDDRSEVEPVLDGDISDPTSVVEELQDESVRDDEGLIQAGSGGADPKENWMGCDLAESIGDDACQDPPPPEG